MAYPAQSHEKMLRKYMEHTKPKDVFEWGPGRSTEIILEHSCVEYLITVEHDKKYYDKLGAQTGNDRMLPVYEPDLVEYPQFINLFTNPFDLVFVDGRMRGACLMLAKNMVKPSGVIILHDAEREFYSWFINKFDFQDWDRPNNEAWTVALR